MSASETPLTDRFIDAHLNYRTVERYLSASHDHARTLERERAALRDALREAHEAMQAFTDPEGKMPEDTGEFRDLSRALATATTILAAVALTDMGAT